MPPACTSPIWLGKTSHRSRTVWNSNDKAISHEQWAPRRWTEIHPDRTRCSPWLCNAGRLIRRNSSGKANWISSILVDSCFSSTRLFVMSAFPSLAGSERQLKTGASGQQLLESAKINLSLSALNKVISSLVHTNTTHIPYRDSKLTRLLQDSIGGTTKTIMIACISPAEDNYDETLCTLRWGRGRSKLPKDSSE